MSTARTRSRLIAVLAVGLTACGESGEPLLVTDDMVQLTQEANQVVLGGTMWVTSDGVRRAQVVADTAFIIDEKATVELRVMTIVFYGEVGDTTSILTSREGEYDWYSQNMVARGDVVVLNPKDGVRVETSVVYYDGLEDRIWGDQPTKMWEADGALVEGTAFETDPRMDRVELAAPSMVKPDAQPLR
ncbi:MAG: hypothetical protein PVI01_16840 [Gemmatimonadales bacterium]|jgi:hypothetical protein